jgi:hypothetical protein
MGLATAGMIAQLGGDAPSPMTHRGANRASRAAVSQACVTADELALGVTVGDHIAALL